MWLMGVTSHSGEPVSTQTSPSAHSLRFGPKLCPDKALTYHIHSEMFKAISSKTSQGIGDSHAIFLKARKFLTKDRVNLCIYHPLVLLGQLQTVSLGHNLIT